MSEFRDQLKVEGIRARGYGILPKMVMLDRKITIEAKAIYSYFCSYAGAGNTAFPSVDKIIKDLCISKPRYYKHRELLQKYGYIEIEQVKGKGNRFSHNIYTLTEKPREQFITTEKNVVNEPSIPSTRFMQSEIMATQNDTTNINSLSNINNSLYNQSIITKNDGMNEFKNILDKLELDTFKEAKEIKQAIRKLYYADKEFKVNGMSIPLNQVREDLKQVTSSCIEKSLNDLYEASTSFKIENTISYLATLIYNNIFSSTLDIRTDINFRRGYN